MGTCLQALQSALVHTTLHPSKADNSGTAIRSTQHWLTRTVNTLSAKSEVSEHQAAFTLLGHFIDTTTDSFSYMNPIEHVAFIKELLPQPKSGSTSTQKQRQRETKHKEDYEQEDDDDLSCWDEVQRNASIRN